MKSKHIGILSHLRENILVKAVAFPFLNKYPAALLLCSTFLTTVLTPFTSYMFPTAEDALKASGINPNVASELAEDRKIRVERGSAGIALDDLGAYLPVVRYAIDLGRAHIAPNARSLRPMEAWNMSGNCIVNTYALDSFSPRELISLGGKGIPIEDIKNSPLSIEKMYAYVLLHEMRHCSKKNTGDDVEQEGDADYHAITIAARELKDPEIITFVFNLRAAKPPSSEMHDVVLYLDAKLNNLPMPSAKEIAEANLLARKFIVAEKKDSVSLTPLAAKRVELYNLGQKYFRNPPQEKEKPPSPAAPKIS